MFSTKLKCGICNVQNVRLYRCGGEFYRPENNRCNSHVTETQRGWYIPLCPDVDGSIWGYGSIPDDALKIFYALPENDPKDWIWGNNGWELDGVRHRDRAK